MKKFNDYNEIKEAYESNKYDIFFENNDKKYTVSNIGSTIFCHDDVKNLGMGAITNFPVAGFYAEEKPIPVQAESEPIGDTDDRESSDPFDDPLNDEQ